METLALHTNTLQPTQNCDWNSIRMFGMIARPEGIINFGKVDYTNKELRASMM
jgi:hypothetical protein